MKEWWQGRKNKKRSVKRRSDQYSLFDLFLDVLGWIPELLFLPFRIIYWLFRGIGRFIGEGFN
jgi:lauroyl/myristoyl acyltransferase